MPTWESDVDISADGTTYTKKISDLYSGSFGIAMDYDGEPRQIKAIGTRPTNFTIASAGIPTQEKYKNGSQQLVRYRAKGVYCYNGNSFSKGTDVITMKLLLEGNDIYEPAEVTLNFTNAKEGDMADTPLDPLLDGEYGLSYYNQKILTIKTSSLSINGTYNYSIKRKGNLSGRSLIKVIGTIPKDINFKIGNTADYFSIKRETPFIGGDETAITKLILCDTNARTGGEAEIHWTNLSADEIETIDSYSVYLEDFDIYEE